MEAHQLLSDENGQEVKIIPFSLEDDGNSPFEAHLHSLKNTLEKVFGKELLSHLSDKIPLVRWTECHKVPSAFFIYLLTTNHRKKEIQHFFEEMVTSWLVPGDELHILSSKNLSFHLKENPNKAYYAVELLVEVSKEKQLIYIQKNLEGLKDELKLSCHSKGYAHHLLEMKGSSLGGKKTLIYETIVSAMKRKPKNFEHDIFRETQRFLIHSNDNFREIRHLKLLCRTILFHYLSQKSILKDLKKSAERRHLYFKLNNTTLHYPFGLKKVVGLAITLNTLKDYECFEERHIMHAISRILPHATYVEDSFYINRNDEEKILSLYLEFQSNSEKHFSLPELKTLKRKLGGELKNSIEYLSPSLFIPRNEEELYRNIIALSQELKYVHDLPQAIIAYQEQNSEMLKFNVILLRILHHNDRSLQELSKALKPSDRFIQERVTRVGLLRKKYTKEANIFSIEIDGRNFLRKNHSVDLVRARQYVVGCVEKLIGQFRDYNGGFLFKQNEQLESIKKEWSEETKEYEYLIENLFYSITPTIIQTLISPTAGKILADLFLKQVQHTLNTSSTLRFEKTEQEEALAIVVKAKSLELKHDFNQVISELHIDSLKLGSATIEHEGFYYICYLYLNPQNTQSNLLASSIENIVHLRKKALKNLQVIHLYLPHATQSLDPRIGSDRTSGIVINMLYERLMGLNPKGELDCALAKSYTISEDGLIYTFYLKETKWSNGYPLTAYDFEYAWKKILEPTFRSPYCFLLFPIKNAENAKRGELPLSAVGIRVKDKYTLEVELGHPALYFLNLTSHWTYAPLCCEIDQRSPGWAYQNAETHVSNGPFKLDAWKYNDDLTLIKNPHYWNAEEVKIRKIEINIVQDDNTVYEMYKKGTLDWFGDPIRKLPLQFVKEFKEKEAIHSSEQFGFFWLHLNVEVPLFSNANLRKAFAYAINRSHLIKDILEKDDEPALRFNVEDTVRKEGLFPDGHLEEARKLFKKGLQEAGLKPHSLPSLTFIHSEIMEHEIISTEIGKMWSMAFGIEVKYERLLWVNFFDTLLRKQDFMVGGLSWYSRYEDPLYYLDLLITREGTPCVTKWRDKNFVHLINQAKKERDSLKRKEIINEAELLVVNEMPLIPVLFDKCRYVKNPRLKGVTLSTIGGLDFKHAYLEENK